MGPTIRPFAYRRDPWWDVDGRTTRRRRRRRLAAWAFLVSLAISLGVLAAEARAATTLPGAPAGSLESLDAGPVPASVPLALESPTA